MKFVIAFHIVVFAMSQPELARFWPDFARTESVYCVNADAVWCAFIHLSVRCFMDCNTSISARYWPDSVRIGPEPSQLSFANDGFFKLRFQLYVSNVFYAFPYWHICNEPGLARFWPDSAGIGPETGQFFIISFERAISL